MDLDHFHPWNDEQGESPFVWSVIGAIGEVTGLEVTTAVTCPTVRIHPAIIAQAAATSALMCRGGFRLGVGSGEALNEHVVGARWPVAEVRLEMLEEAIDISRALGTGERVNHHGTHYTVEDARLYTRPADPVPILVSAFGPKALSLAARVGDGPSREDSIKTVHRLWANAGVPGELAQVLPSPKHFEQVAELVGPEIAEVLPALREVGS